MTKKREDEKSIFRYPKEYSMNETSYQKWLKVLFYLTLIGLVIPIWQSKFFVTNDGPCHLYNSAVLKDLFLGNHTEFYANYYTLNPELEPNWFTHAAYTFLQLIFPPFLAEKILMSAYLFGFVFSLKQLLHTIGKDKAYWLLMLGMPLLYQKIFLMGFFNCAFSYIFFMMVLNYYLKRKDKLKFGHGLLIMLLLVITYFTHPMGLFLSIACIGAIFLYEFFSDDFRSKKALLAKGKKSLILLLAILPSVILMLSYMLRSNQPSQELATSTKVLFHQLIEGNFLFNFNNSEKLIAAIFAATFGLAFFTAIYFKYKKRSFKMGDVFGILFLLLVLLYFNLPGYVAGGAFFVERLQFIIFFILLFWLASIEIPLKLRFSYAALACAANLVLMCIRIPTTHKMSKAAEEVLEAAPFIKDESTLLPLSYNHSGCTTDGELIADHFWVFMHIGDYIGTEKAVVTLGNYEANTGYFPLNYKDEKNPFANLGNIEGQPPNPDLLEYPERTGGTIDYVLLFCYQDNMADIDDVARTFNVLNTHYEKIFTSSNDRAILYKHNDK
ncbi:hypothetical protein K6119_15115 [Paracrocinitomix mangrovi]|uniref:hypothetical protein n=1 Tax=Paracrocinitomix mangrovi TaxID=2862509 RepID=UPI001C8ED1B7|nr:hypothetical protein [Paracrocinitomix mangrovi]UKN01059.1 hypothetical protein K6119_15115 [Paracrocinitomix mangrovi]